MKLRLKPWVAAVLLTAASFDAAANCKGEIEGPIENQIGTIAVFSSRAKGPMHALYGSEFWAISGPHDTHIAHTYPIEFAPELMSKVNSWNWSNAAVAPIILDVRVDGVLRGEYVWLVVREVLETEEQYNAAISKYPESRRGTCGSLFRRS